MQERVGTGKEEEGEKKRERGHAGEGTRQE